jgi:hypothetical protein
METYYTIEPSAEGDGYWLVKHGEYGPSSVLAGQPSRALTKFYASLDEAKFENPEAEVLEWSTKDPFGGPELPQTAPDWFDPLNAGEVWGEEDY